MTATEIRHLEAFIMSSSLSLPLQDRLLNILPFLDDPAQRSLFSMLQSYEDRRKEAKIRYYRRREEIFHELTQSLASFAHKTKLEVNRLHESKERKDEEAELTHLEEQLSKSL